MWKVSQAPQDMVGSNEALVSTLNFHNKLTQLKKKAFLN